MAFEIMIQELVVAITLMVIAQGLILVEGVKRGDALFYYIPATFVGVLVLWSSLVVFPGVLP